MNQEKKKRRRTDNSYAKYSAMGFQMAVIIGLGVFCGIKLDEYLGLKNTPLFTVSFSLLSVFAAIYFAVRDLLEK